MGALAKTVSDTFNVLVDEIRLKRILCVHVLRTRKTCQLGTIFQAESCKAQGKQYTEAEKKDFFLSAVKNGETLLIHYLQTIQLLGNQVSWAAVVEHAISFDSTH